MVKTKTPNKLLDDCLEYESLIRSNTAHDVYKLGGEVAETIVSGETPDISQLCELGWYEWCKFRNVAAPFPQDKMVLGRYLGPSVDIGSAMTAKILKANGQVIHMSAYRSLTPGEVAQTEEEITTVVEKLLINESIRSLAKARRLRTMKTTKSRLLCFEKNFRGRKLLKRVPTPFENDYAIRARTGYDAGIEWDTSHLISVANPCIALDGRIGQSRYHYRNVDVSFTDSYAKRGTSRGNVQNVCVSEDQAQFKDGV
jgi:hypothetical protein